jgi:hypothetical protein
VEENEEAVEGKNAAMGGEEARLDGVEVDGAELLLRVEQVFILRASIAALLCAPF